MFLPASASLIFTPASVVLGGGGFEPSAVTSPNRFLILNFPLPRNLVKKKMTTPAKIAATMTIANVFSITFLSGFRFFLGATGQTFALFSNGWRAFSAGPLARSFLKPAVQSVVAPILILPASLSGQ